MRIVIVLGVWVGTVWAQKPANDAANLKAELAAVQAQLLAAKAQEAARQAQVDDLSKRYSDNYPDLADAKKALEEVHEQGLRLEKQLDRYKVLAASGFLPPQTPAESLKIALPDRWWKNAATAQFVGLTADQQKKMDEVFQQYRLKLIDLNGTLQKEEVTLEPLVSAEPLDEAKITAQIDRVAQARAELEKANGRMLLGIRKLLTPDQWSKLNEGFALMPAKKVTK
jgi:Spy/CpxP family protein refolding chaperone